MGVDGRRGCSSEVMRGVRCGGGDGSGVAWRGCASIGVVRRRRGIIEYRFVWGIRGWLSSVVNVFSHMPRDVVGVVVGLC